MDQAGELMSGNVGFGGVVPCLLVSTVIIICLVAVTIFDRQDIY